MFAVSFAIIVVLRPPLFAENVVSKSPCLRFEAFMFAVRYNYVGEIGRPEMEEFCPDRRAGWRHFDFKHQQGDCDREDTVAKCLQTGGIHAHLLCE
jgi:hypothetical protein